MSLQHVGCMPFTGAAVREFSGEAFRVTERNYAPNTRLPVHAHTRAFVGVTLHGVYTQMRKGERQEFRPGNITFTPAGVPHESHYSETGVRLLHIEVSARVLQRFTSAGLDSQRFIVLRGGPPQLAAQQLYKEFQSPDTFSPLLLDGLAMRFLVQIFRQQSFGPKRRPSWLAEAETYICNNYPKHVLLDEIARAVKVHPVHLAREYRQHYKRTVGERLRELRFGVACKDLRNTSRSIVEIALSAGYSDQSHFSVAFKKHLGLTPSEYRHHANANFANIC